MRLPFIFAATVGLVSQYEMCFAFECVCDHDEKSGILANAYYTLSCDYYWLKVDMRRYHYKMTALLS